MNAPLLSAEALSAIRADENGYRRIKITDRATWLAWRQDDVTASVAGCLLGVHDYMTPYQLWALKTGALAEDSQETGPMERGRLLEPVALNLLAEKRPSWRIDPGGYYYRDPAHQLGATPDALVIDPERKGFGVVQIKTVEPSVFRRKWRSESNEIEPPLWIAVQAIVEAELSGASWACVAAMTVGFGVDLTIIDVPLHRGVLARLTKAAAEFWRCVRANEPPPPDFARDGAVLAALRGHDSGTTVDLRENNRIGELLEERLALKEREADGAAAERARKAVDAEILHILGDAACGTLPDGRVIEAKTTTRRAYTVKENSYRVIKVIGAPSGAHAS